MQEELLGLIAGNGKFPILFAQKAKSKKIKIIAAGVKGDTSIFLRFFVDKISTFNVGDLKKLFKYFKENNVRKVIMAGQVNPDNLFDQKVSLDGEFKKLFEAMQDRKADTIFSALADKLNEHGIELVDSTFLLKDHLAPKGILTEHKPTKTEEQDIVFGQSIAKAMGDIDVGQTVVVKEKAILAIEAMEGTDQTILRGGRIAKGGALVAKMSKPAQDLRFDVPVIGSKTIRTMIKANASTLVIEAGKTIIIDLDLCVRLANRAGISIVSI